MRETVVQAVKYGVVGAGNTVITAIVIWVFMKLFGCSDVTSNVVGYAAGVLNSFVWNKKWTFHSSTGWMEGAARFGAVFGICYLLQLGLLVYVLNPYVPIDPYYNQLIAMAFYTVVNFVMNKFYTFKD